MWHGLFCRLRRSKIVLGSPETPTFPGLGAFMVFVVQVIPAGGVCQGRVRLIGRLHALGNELRADGLHHRQIASCNLRLMTPPVQSEA